MKRLALALLLAFAFPAAVRAAACTTTGAATNCATNICKFSDPNSWASCGGAIPTTTDTFTVANGHTVDFDDTAQSVQGFTVVTNGQLLCSDGANNRDANGYRVLTVTGISGINDILLQTNTAIRWRHGCKLILDGTTEQIDFHINTSTSFIDFQGRVAETAVTAVADNDADNTNCGASFAGTARSWDITVDRNRASRVLAASSALLAGRRVVFRTGELRPRHFEIISVPSDGVIRICSGLPSADSAGQYLTPFVSLGSQVSFANKHTVQSITDDTAAWYGAPAVGDEISIVEDARLLGTGNANGKNIKIVGGGYDTMPLFYATTIGGVASTDTFGLSGDEVADLRVTAAGTTIWQDLEYNNFFGWAGTYGLLYQTAQNMNIQWNALHDQPAAGSSNAPMFGVVEANNRVLAPANLTIWDNVIYRTRAHAIYVSSSLTGNSVCATNVSMRRNLAFDGVTFATTPPEPPFALVLVGCTGCDMSYNRAQNWFGPAADPVDPFGLLASASDADASCRSQNTTVFRNFGVNCGTSCLGGGGNNVVGNLWAATGNYFSHAYMGVATGGQAFGNILKNSHLLGDPSPLVRRSATFVDGEGLVAGNFIAGNPDTATTGACVNASDDGCATSAIGLESVWTQSSNPEAVTYRDNLLLYPDSDAANTCAVLEAGYEGDVTFDHDTCDGFRDVVTDAGAMTGFGVAPSAPVDALTATVSDCLTTHLNAGVSVTCGSHASLTETVGTIFRVNSSQTTEQAGTSAGTCTTGPTFVVGAGADQFVDRRNFNYALRPGSPARTACSGGSPCGARGFYFNLEPMRRIWGELVVDGIMPPSFCNLTDTTQCADPDGDSVMALHDNCDGAWNPSQYDGDADGAGCACDGAGGGDACP